MSCLHYSHREKFQNLLKVHTVGIFSVFKKLDAFWKVRKYSETLQNPLHQWSLHFEKENQKKDDDLGGIIRMDARK